MAETKKEYATKDYTPLLGLTGFSEALLKNHFTLYDGYVKNVNKLSAALAKLLQEGQTASSEYMELKRRFGWEFGGMRLHEHYFDNLTRNRTPLGPESKLAKALAREFGSLELWEKDFKAVGTMRGIGWVTLAFDPCSGRLFNVWTNEHDAGNLPGCHPVLVMDVFEHAFMLDYGLKRADYVNAFFAAIDWTKAAERFERASAAFAPAGSCCK
ncbi:MAG TPA: superoxide dismutase [Elusimicrobia bacterium]|nr:superoxide dismutase [Elusimicrobiota bacterium]